MPDDIPACEVGEVKKSTERTIELTNFCPFDCSYCSSNSISDLETGDYQELLCQQVYARMHEAKDDGIEIIHISGGEPMIHCDIGWILLEARHLFGRGVVLHTNLIPQIAYNPNVCEGVRIHAYMTPDQVDVVHVLKRIKQGREARAPVLAFREDYVAKEPAVHCSANWRHQCHGDCGHLVIRPDNTVVCGPCRKFDSAQKEQS